MTQQLIRHRHRHRRRHRRRHLLLRRLFHFMMT